MTFEERWLQRLVDEAEGERIKQAYLRRAEAERRDLLRGRRHHNNDGRRQIREGKTWHQVKAIAARILGAGRKP